MNKEDSQFTYDHDDEFNAAIKALPLETPSGDLDHRVNHLFNDCHRISDIETDLKESLTSSSRPPLRPWLHPSILGMAACLVMALGIFRFQQAVEHVKQLPAHMASTNTLLDKQPLATSPIFLPQENAAPSSVSAHFVGTNAAIPDTTTDQPNFAQLHNQSLVDLLRRSHQNVLNHSGLSDNLIWHKQNQGQHELHLKIAKPYDRLIIHDASGRVIFNGAIAKSE